jgi:hypothetical protein
MYLSLKLWWWSGTLLILGFVHQSSLLKPLLSGNWFHLCFQMKRIWKRNFLFLGVPVELLPNHGPPCPVTKLENCPVSSVCNCLFSKTPVWCFFSDQWIWGLRRILNGGHLTLRLLTWNCWNLRLNEGKILNRGTWNGGSTVDAANFHIWRQSPLLAAWGCSVISCIPLNMLNQEINDLGEGTSATVGM